MTITNESHDLILNVKYYSNLYLEIINLYLGRCLSEILLIDISFFKLKQHQNCITYNTCLGKVKKSTYGRCEDTTSVLELIVLLVYSCLFIVLFVVRVEVSSLFLSREGIVKRCLYGL